MEPLSANLQKSSEATGLSVNKLRRMIKAKEVKASRCGKRLLIPISELKRITGTK